MDASDLVVVSLSRPTAALMGVGDTERWRATFILAPSMELYILGAVAELWRSEYAWAGMTWGTIGDLQESFMEGGEYLADDGLSGGGTEGDRFCGSALGGAGGDSVLKAEVEPTYSAGSLALRRASSAFRRVSRTASIPSDMLHSTLSTSALLTCLFSNGAHTPARTVRHKRTEQRGGRAP